MKIYTREYLTDFIKEVLDSPDFEIFKLRKSKGFFVTFQGVRLFTMIKPYRSSWIFLSDVLYAGYDISAFCIKDNITLFKDTINFIYSFLEYRYIKVYKISS